MQANQKNKSQFYAPFPDGAFAPPEWEDAKIGTLTSVLDQTSAGPRPRAPGTAGRPGIPGCGLRPLKSPDVRRSRHSPDPARTATAGPPGPGERAAGEGTPPAADCPPLRLVKQGVQRDLLLPGRAPPLVHRQVVQGLHQPALRTRVGPQRLPLKEGQKERLLDQVLRALRTAHQAIGRPEQLFIQLEIQRVDPFIVSVQLAAHLGSDLYFLAS